ncbi:putative ubiquitin-like protein yukD [Bhargavaea cecembensis DSE10]|uniref:Putative ubiquitin-like protein yukD n=1 Tax=Bhargavaea cecembensis DSE10 TaxID=1235279 RepID=M7NKX2_9BACL|nr:EsaB/YukD family protein [Bhargavaea cecembensis]EMR07761.1 putative ubiquitin-like protein yukD [Bhargavaea cecembensis DSE10]
MYIEVTVDLSKYEGGVFDLRLSDYHTFKKLADIAREAKGVTRHQREGHWVRVVNKNRTYPGHLTMAHCGITSGDRLEIL